MLGRSDRSKIEPTHPHKPSNRGLQIYGTFLSAGEYGISLFVSIFVVAVMGLLLQ